MQKLMPMFLYVKGRVNQQKVVVGSVNLAGSEWTHWGTALIVHWFAEYSGVRQKEGELCLNNFFCLFKTSADRTVKGYGTGGYGWCQGANSLSGSSVNSGIAANSSALNETESPCAKQGAAM